VEGQIDLRDASVCEIFLVKIAGLMRERKESRAFEDVMKERQGNLGGCQGPG